MNIYGIAFLNLFYMNRTSKALNLSYETSSGLNNKSIKRRTSNVERPMWSRFAHSF
jgi:hypothetical protein